MPPTTAMPRPVRLVPDNPKLIGMAPPIVATDVMRIGRNRRSVPFSAASHGPSPSDFCTCCAYSTIRMPFFVTRPTSRMRPTCAKNDSVEPVIRSAAKAPASASGTASRIEIGARNDRAAPPGRETKGRQEELRERGRAFREVLRLAGRRGRNPGGSVSSASFRIGRCPSPC
jgi:hypothetical protein